MEEEQGRVEKGMNTELIIMISKVGAFSEDRRNPPPEITRVCEECGKVFSSGKAYGGHKRIHNQLIKGDLIPESKLAQALIKKEGFYNSDGEDHITCSECGRGFPTWKSLFGHMRSHPERTWRGIRPAPAPAPVRASYCSSSSTLSWEDERGESYDPTAGGNNLSATAGAAVNLMESLKGSWAATAKRGRSAITAVNPGTENGNRGGREEEEDKMNQGVNDLLMFAKIPQPKHEDPEFTKKSRKKRRLEELDDESRGREFHCDICNKQFSSHQALGGHKASHNNKLRKPEAYWFNGGEAEQHKCNICGLIFPTGQALGGHKRRHWIGSPAGSSSQGTGQVSSRRPVLQFDLNEPPPAPVEDSQVNAQSASLCNSISG